MECPNCNRSVKTVYGNGEYPNSSYRCDHCYGEMITSVALWYAILAVLIVFLIAWAGVPSADAQLVFSPQPTVKESLPAQEPVVKKSFTTERETSKPTITGYYFKSCSLCVVAKQWAENSLPFKIKWVEDPQYKVITHIRKHYPNQTNHSYPIFEFPSKHEDGLFWHYWGADKSGLLGEWALRAATTPTDELGVVQKQNLDMVCGCRSENADCCLCLQEIEAGTRKKPCTCSETKGSKHYVESHQPGNWNPSGATGEYYDFETKRVTVPGPAKQPDEAAPTPHYEVRKILSELDLDSSKVLLDPGCGSAARFCIAASSLYGCDSIGIEIDRERASQAKALVDSLGLSDKVTIIHGDCRDFDFSKADVAAVYLYPDLLEEIRPSLQKLDKFASYLHPVPGLSMTTKGDMFLWNKQPAVQQAVWNGKIYPANYRGCSKSNCVMCRSIRTQLRSN